MESHAEAQVKNSRAVRYDAGHLLQEAPLVTDCGTLVQNKHNFNFGAEIVKTRAMATEHERNIKTNTEKTSAPTTSTLVASTCSVDECATTIETPLSVSELPPISNVDNWVEEGGAGACGGANQDRDGNGSDEDGGDENDSYQSDDDDEDEDDDNETSQQELDGRRNVDASLESDDSSTDSDFSDLSGLSDMSGREWKPISTRPINWVQKQIHAGADPRELLSQMLPTGAHQIAPGVNDMMLWRILASMLAEPPRRQKLRHVNTFEDVIQLVQQSENIIVLTGAGVSVSCGIPDFRSSDGIYSRLAKDYPDLPDPQAMFDINYFSRDPRPFFKFAREIYPGQFKPSPCHRFIKLLEQKQKLLRNYTQNIDTLEQVAGIRNVIECHGSFSTASCTKCKLKCTADAIREDIFVQRIPVCRRCQPNVEQSVDASEPVSEMELRRLVENGIMKPDIVFFGEGLPEEFHTVMASDKDKCDLLIVMGSSLKVRPVALIPSSIPAHVPQILINREQLHHLEFDVELLGDSDVIINQLCHRLGGDWKDICFNEVVLQECKELLPLEEDTITDGDGEEDGQQLLDTDTQSIKSSASTDIALRSDSGFESSTSSGMVVGKIIGATTASGEAIEAIEQIKSTILQLDSPLTKMKSPELLPPDLLDEPPEAASFEHRSFHPFSACVEQETISTMTLTASSYADNMRHLSIDSSKDSGIQCDSSNSALPCNSNVGTLPPPSTNFNVNDTIVSTQPNTSTAVAAASHELNDSSQVGGAEVQREQRKHLSAAERLVDGTYYCHESSASYVFPGAQVSWCADSGEEEEEDDDDNENDFGLELDGDIDANGAPLSPLMPPSVEAEVVSEITTTSAFAICAKRHAAISSDAETLATMHNMTPGDSSSVSDDHSARLANCTPPPSKKRREMGAELEAMPKAATAAAFIAHTTTSSTPTAGSSSNNFDATGTAVMATETLLQQF